MKTDYLNRVGQTGFNPGVQGNAELVNTDNGQNLFEKNVKNVLWFVAKMPLVI